MKSLMQLLKHILLDVEIWCSTDTTLDFLEIERRVEDEGLQFLTITLPTFGSDFEKSLDLGYIDPSRFQGFARTSRRGPLPKLFSGLVGRVFCSSSGRLLDEPCIHSIRAVRQVCLMWKKIRTPCSKERTQNAYAKFVKTNVDCIEFNIRAARAGFDLPRAFSGTDACLRPRTPKGTFARRWSSEHRRSPVASCSRWNDRRSEFLGLRSRLNRFSIAADLLWGTGFRNLTERLDSGDLLPRHGPGATADRIVGNNKFDIRRWHSRLEHRFPLSRYAIPSYEWHSSLSRVDVVPPEQERPVRVITVPKTHKTPRIIAIEPVCMQYTQQALMAPIVEFLEKHSLARGHVNFTSQEVNQGLSLRSSKDGSYATLDLSDASDRVPSSLVWLMFRQLPEIRDAVFACRSLKAAVPGLGVIPLGRFASMGSALCFPVEAMVFYTIVVAALAKHDNVQLSGRTVRSYARQVYVYGDDIIVPVEYVQTVVSELEGLNLRVNGSKSFGKGKFRESCGLDAYDGHRVTPVYVREFSPTSRQDIDGLESWVSLANQLYEVGYWRSSSFCRKVISRFHNLPIVSRESPLLGWHSYTHVREVHRYNQNLQNWETRSVRRWSPKEISPISDMPALMKIHLRGGGPLMYGNIYEPAFRDVEHLRYAGRPQRAYTKVGWSSY